MRGVQLVVKISRQPARAASQKRKMLKLYNYLSEIIPSSCKICCCCIYHDHSWASYITLEALNLNATHNGPETAVSSGRSAVHDACRVYPSNGELNSHNRLCPIIVAKTTYAERMTKGVGCRWTSMDQKQWKRKLPSSPHYVRWTQSQWALKIASKFASDPCIVYDCSGGVSKGLLSLDSSVHQAWEWVSFDPQLTLVKVA